MYLILQHLKIYLFGPEELHHLQHFFKVFVHGQSGGYISLGSLLSYKGTDAPIVAIDPRNDVAFLPYSSGTTGKPKGVMLTHYNLIANCCQSCHPDVEMSRTDDVTVWPLPFYHIYGIATIICFTACVGGTTVILQRFHLETYLRTIEKYRATFLYIVPPIVLQLARSPLVAKFDLSSLRILWCGAAPLGKDLITEVTNRLKNVSVKQGYGMTETCTRIMFPPVRNWKNGSAGILAPNSRCKILDVNSGEVLESYKEGEICIQAPQVMKGYLGNTTATNLTIDKEGWLHTGDIGYYDAEQNFFIVDRLKELIKYKGFQVAPAELESLILTHPCVLDVAVIGRPDEEAGELPMAFVVRKHENHATDKDIISYVEERVAPHKRLRGGIYFVNKIPKSDSGKILRKALRDELKLNRMSKL